MARPNFVSLTKQDIQALKSMIRTGEPVYQIAKRMAPQYNRTTESFMVTLYKLAKQTRKIAQWNGGTRRTKRKAQPVAVETVTASKSTTPRVEKYPDHIRIYF
jgi:hypothetical protein